MISTITLDVLTSAGWYIGRQVNIDKSVSLLQSKGYPIFPELVHFLTEFEGLGLHYLKREVKRFLSFDIAWCLSKSGLYEDDIIIEDYPRAIGCNQLTLIGRGNTDTALAISEKDMIYTLYDGYILELGKGLEATDNIITKTPNELTQVPMPGWWGE